MFQERRKILIKNSIYFNHCFLFNIENTFNIKDFVQFVNYSLTPLSQVYFFTGNKIIRDKIKDHLFPVWEQIFIDQETKSNFYVNYNSILKNKFDHIKKIQHITTRKFSSFLIDVEKIFHLRNIYYVYVGPCGITLNLLKGFEKYLKKITMLEMITEKYQKWEDQYTQDQVFDFLCQNNFKLKFSKIINHFQNKSIWIKK